MISFKQFITEGKTFDLERFKTDCAFMLEQLKGSKGQHLLYHGTMRYPKGDWEIRNFKERAKPRDSDVYLHTQVNKLFTDMFGGPARNWLFTTGNVNDAYVYGKTFDGVLVIFPIGKFEWLCGLDQDLSDITGWHSRVFVQMTNTSRNLPYEKRLNNATDYLVSKMRHMHWLHNEKLIECIKSGNEIHVKCERFYAFKLGGYVFTDIVKPFLETL
jgi:hypothetical protein